MDRREQTLAKGYLVKSPVKKGGRDKSSFSKFWNLRWCVLVQVLYIDINDFVEDAKLVVNYYKDEESYKKDDHFKGQLNISQCKSIKSCFNPHAGFDHTFTLEFDDGKQVWFSAPTCEQKFRWILLLYKYRFNPNIESLVKKFGIPGFLHRSNSQKGILENDDAITQNATEKPVMRIGSLKSRTDSLKRQSRDSGMFPPIDSLSIDSHSDDAPPLPPRLYSNVSLFGNENDPNTSPVSEDGNFDMGVLQIFNDLFTLCSVCQTTPKRRNRNSKKWDKSPGDMEEVKRSGSLRRSMVFDGDAISQSSSSSASEDSMSSELNDPRYSKIDEKWIEDIKKKLGKEKDEEPDKNDAETANDSANASNPEYAKVNRRRKSGDASSKSEETTIVEQEKDEDEKENTRDELNDLQNENCIEEDVYMDMNQYQQDVQEQSQDDVIETQASAKKNDDLEKVEKDTSKDADNLQKYFEMDC
ncbi:uncharacterized protein LOC135687644 [Rhopilema esculentum]|uniref:uncharacterized protein LOC135687644 n=1 Tax=Rhopilema esculentum TaxID=499914 RepID=UPI0031E3AA69|eukprot:gene6358-11793_t